MIDKLVPKKRVVRDRIDPIKVMLSITLFFSFFLLWLTQKALDGHQVVPTPPSSPQLQGSQKQQRQEEEESKQQQPPPSSQKSLLTFNPAFRHLGFSADTLYEQILDSFPKRGGGKHIVIEVGCFNTKQARFAAEKGFKVVAVEASPNNYRRMVKEYDEMPTEVKNRITIHHNAASSKSGETLIFDGVGGTGDHVSGMNLDAAQKRKYEGKEKQQVRSVAMDDVVAQLPADEFVHLLKVDTQGHEGFVFRGLTETLTAGKIRFIMFEYWVDALDQVAGHPSGSCTCVPDILVPLVEAGYALFDLSVSTHPKTKPKPTSTDTFYRPLEFYENCQWYHKKGKEATEYGMGYWTDVLAVYGGDFTKNEITISFV